MAKLIKSNDRSFTPATVRLIGPEGEQLGVVTLAKAHDTAKASGQDLVLVSDKADPPVVRVMNFGKLQYEHKKNIKAQKKNNTAQKLKEIKFHVNIDKHDFDFKVKHGLDFLEKGYRLKVTLALRGREMAHQELAYEVMNRAMNEFKPYADADGEAKLIGRNISVNFAPKSVSGTSEKKKPSGKAADEVAE